MKTSGIAFRLATLTLACATLIFVCIMAYNYSVSRSIIVKLAEEKGEYLAQATVERIGKVLYSVRKVADSISYSLEKDESASANFDKLGRRVLIDNPEIFGTAIAFAPYAFDPEKKYYAPYHYRLQNRVCYTNLGSDDYEYFYMDWFQLARELHRPVWTEPYFDEGGGHELMATYSVPFYSNRGGLGEFQGVVTADVSLKWIQKLVSKISVYDSGYVFMLSRYGTYIANPDPDLVMNETIFTNAETLEKPELREIGRKMVAGESGFEALKALPGVGDCFIYYMPLPGENWSIGIVFPKAEMFAGVTRLNHVMIGMGIIGVVALALFIIYLSRSITKPLRKLTSSANEIASGNLEVVLPQILTRDEVGDLATSFKTMKDSLKKHIETLTETTAAKERIESELRIAHDIQMGILPKLFPAFPERSEFDVFASIEPAREVGGDLYDFFFVDERHFCFLVGDVSGKGVPAAFFMAVTKTLLKVVAERGLDPGEVLAKVSNDLAEENDSCMFVTLFLAVMDIETGEIRYASAGHNPPVYLPASGEPEWVPPLNEPVAGAMEGMDYTTKTMTMAPGDILFIYTDGVTEAMDASLELYNEDRLMNEIVRCSGKGAEEVVARVNASIKAFTGGAEQSDDITMLAMQYCGKDCSK